MNSVSKIWIKVSQYSFTPLSYNVSTCISNSKNIIFFFLSSHSNKPFSRYFCSHFLYFHNMISYPDLPMLQVGPVHPGVQWQWYDPNVFSHRAPWRQGLRVIHSSISTKLCLLSHTQLMFTCSTKLSLIFFKISFLKSAWTIYFLYH